MSRRISGGSSPGGPEFSLAEEMEQEAQVRHTTDVIKFKLKLSLGLECCIGQGRTRLSDAANYSIGHAEKGPSFWLQESVFTLNSPVKLSEFALVCN